MRFSGIRPNLSPDDEEVKRKLAKCSLRMYSKLIILDIPRPFGTKYSQPSALRPSEPSVMKPSREELHARVELLAKKKRSVKHNVPAAPESYHVARGKVQKLGASSLSSSIREQGSLGQFRVRGHTLHLMGEVPVVANPQPRSPPAMVAKNPPRRTAEPPLDILPISVWNP